MPLWARGLRKPTRKLPQNRWGAAPRFCFGDDPKKHYRRSLNRRARIASSDDRQEQSGLPNEGEAQMHAKPTPSPLATLEEALKTPAFWAVLMALEHCALRDPAFIRAIGGCEFEALISDLRLARLERSRRQPKPRAGER